MVPQSRAIPVLITRPEPQASRFAGWLTARFGDRVTPVISPLMAVRYDEATLPPGPFAAIILTSEAGAVAAGRLQVAGQSLPRRAYCVGARTAQVALAQGFDPISADGDAVDLIALITAQPPGGRLIHLRGRESRGAVAARLQAAGQEVAELVTYAQEPAALTEAARACLSGADRVAVPLFSPRSAVLFRDSVDRATMTAPLVLFVMSQAVARELADFPVHSLHIAPEPTQAAMGHMMSQALFGA